MKACAGSRLLLGAFDEKGVAAAAEAALADCGGQPTCGFLFVSADWLPQIGEVLDLIRLHGRIPLLVGTIGGGLIGTGEEAEGASGMSLLLVRLPETKLTPVLITAEQVEQSTGPATWHAATGLGPDEVDAWIILANPTVPGLEQWLAEWNQAYPNSPCIGGLASGGRESGIL